MFPNIKQPKGKTALDGDVDISRVMASHLEVRWPAFSDDGGAPEEGRLARSHHG